MERAGDAAARAAKARKVRALAYAYLAKRRQAQRLLDTVLLAVLQAALEEEQTRAPRCYLHERYVMHVLRARCCCTHVYAFALNCMSCVVCVLLVMGAHAP